MRPTALLTSVSLRRLVGRSVVDFGRDDHPHRVHGCVTAFTPFVTAALDKIDAVCDQFIPPG